MRDLNYERGERRLNGRLTEPLDRRGGSGTASYNRRGGSGAWSQWTPEGPPPVRTPVEAVLGMPPRVFVRVHPKPLCTAPPRCHGWEVQRAK